MVKIITRFGLERRLEVQLAFELLFIRPG
jgi:hypothetical protein